MRVRQQQSMRPGFTLIELLVVIAIVLLASLVAIPTLVTNLNGRQVTDAARIFTGGLVGARDSAIKYNSPRGIRLLPDPMLTRPAPGVAGAGTTQLCYNRFIPIEPAGDYSEGRITIGPLYPGAGFPPPYPRGASSTVYPFPVPATVPPVAQVLMVEESPFVGGYVIGPAGAKAGQPNSPTSWYWNIRVGDKIKIGGSGRAYTVVGPCVVNPWSTNGGYTVGNPELFVNVGPPGTQVPLTRTYYDLAGKVVFSASASGAVRPEFLFVVNGEDDDGDGFTDEGWDGFNQNADLLNGVANIDEVGEWETEKWMGSLSVNQVLDPTATTESPSSAWITNSFQTGTHDAPYLIQRRPVASPGAREVMLPVGMVIDATTWDSTRERSRIPVSPGSLYCDIMVDPSGLYIPTTEYSTPTSANPLPFLHFWITDREDVHPVGSLKDSAGNPIVTATTAQPYLLPMPADTPGYLSVPGTPTLKADRRLVTMFTQSGLVTTNTIESIPALNAYQPGEGFNVTNVSYPYYKAQLGQREAR